MSLYPVPLAGGGVEFRGALSLEPTPAGVIAHRLPARYLRRVPAEFFRVVESQPSGVRLAFQTTATVIELDVVTTALTFTETPPASFGFFDLLIDGAFHSRDASMSGGIRQFDFLAGTSRVAPGTPETIRFAGLPESNKLVELWLPHDVEVELLALRADKVMTMSTPETPPSWVHYGSSISHGSNAEHPTGTWPAVAAHAAGLDLQNLAFAGSALLEPFMAQAIRDTPADIISLELGINVVNHNAYGARMFTPLVHGFLDTIREGHPTTPIWIISPLLCPIIEDAPGPTVLAPDGQTVIALGTAEHLQEGRLNLRAIRELLVDIVVDRAPDDLALHYVDGRELYGEPEAASMPLPDDLHPGPDAHRHIGERFAAIALSAVTESAAATRA
ncbi:MAG TPA: GDSL-type esterase/lipase family protein [Homoserinimonas sp.]|nr:GDSL-type esterase/lipase family protein [Homoserinimonas sp.]